LSEAPQSSATEAQRWASDTAAAELIQTQWLAHTLEQISDLDGWEKKELCRQSQSVRMMWESVPWFLVLVGERWGPSGDLPEKLCPYTKE